MSEIKRLEGVHSASGSPWVGDDEEDYCPFCAEDVYGSHYHCGRCGEVSSMVGHYKIINDEDFNIQWEGFTCDPNNERSAEWVERFKDD